MKTHVKQVAAFEQLLGHCNAQGASYNPSTASIKSTALTALLQEAQETIQTVHKAQNDRVHAINLRHRAFDGLPILGTRIIAALESVDTPPDLVADVNRIRLTFRSQPLTKAQRLARAKEAKGRQPTEVQGTLPVTFPHRRSQQDFNSKIENFTAIIGLLGKEPFYVPNETDLTIEGLSQTLAGMRDTHRDVAVTELALYNARQLRKKKLFGAHGIYGVANRVKKYVRSVFGFSSQQHQSVYRIKFGK